MTLALGCPGLMLCALVFPQGSAGQVLEQTALLMGGVGSLALEPGLERAALTGRGGARSSQNDRFDRKRRFDCGGLETSG